MSLEEVHLMSFGLGFFAAIPFVLFLSGPHETVLDRAKRTRNADLDRRAADYVRMGFDPEDARRMAVVELNSEARETLEALQDASQELALDEPTGTHTLRIPRARRAP